MIFDPWFPIFYTNVFISIISKWRAKFLTTKTSYRQRILEISRSKNRCRIGLRAVTHEKVIKTTRPKKLGVHWASANWCKLLRQCPLVWRQVRCLVACIGSKLPPNWLVVARKRHQIWMWRQENFKMFEIFVARHLHRGISAKCPPSGAKCPPSGTKWREHIALWRKHIRLLESTGM